MKKISFICLLIICSITLSAQLNNLNDTELFNGIKFNQVTLGEIMRSNGEIVEIKSFFGNDIQEAPNNTGPYLAKEFSNNDIYLHFEDETDTGSDYSLTYISVKSNDIIVEVKGISLKLGDSKNKLSNYQFNTNSQSYVFTDQETGSLSLSFKIDDATNKISKIDFKVY